MKLSPEQGFSGTRENKLFHKTIQICGANFKLVSNKKELLLFKEGRIADIRTDFYQIKEIKAPPEKIDAHFYMFDENTQAQVQIGSDAVLVQGSLLELERDTQDVRFSLLGNEGLFFRFVLKVLEDKYNIFSFHACSLFDERKGKLYIICGGAGSGKTAYLLKGIEEGLKVFSTEMTHFKFCPDGRLTFYKGSVFDNVRVGNLKYDCPKACELLNAQFPAPTEDEWGTKVPVDFSQLQTSFNCLQDPEIILVFPHIEQERKKSLVNEVKDKRDIKKRVFDNLSEKIGGTILLYEKICVAGLDTPSCAKNRLLAADRLTRYKKLYKAATVVAGTKNCLEGVRE